MKVFTTASGGEVSISIQDTGKGLSEDELKQITNPFYTTKSPGEGTGLGLPITYNIIKEHSGKLLFDSQLGQGTRVTITLPFSK